MNTVLSRFRNIPLAYALVAVVVLAGGFMLFGGKKAEEQVITVEKGSFVQEVSVSGKVVAAQDVDLGFSQGGRVSGVYAKVGDTVARGAALAELENGDLRAAVLQREASLAAQKAKLASLKQGTRPEEIAVAEAEVESDMAGLFQADQALLDEIQDAYRSADNAISNEVDQIFNNPRSADPQIKFPISDTQLEIDLELSRLGLGSLLASWGSEVGMLGASSDLLTAADQVQKDLAQISSFLGKANAALNRAVATPIVSQTTIDGYIADVASARSAINTAVSALTSAVTAQKNASARLATSKKNLALKQAGTIQADIDAQEAQVKAAEADLASAHASLAKTIMRAPFTGIVTTMDLKAGSIASASVSEASMISSGVFQIESFVPEVNIALIEVGDNAKVTLDAYGSGVVFEAAVASIDPAETIRDGVSTYKTILEFAEDDPRIRSGMTANVRIMTDEREGIISIPQGLVLERDGKKFVVVKAGEGVEEREITVGAVSSLGNIEIVNGLSEGDQVVLSP